MKQLLIFAISLCALSLNAQIKYTPLDAAGYQFKYGKADSGWHVPLRDTSIGRGASRAGAIVYKPGVGFFGWNGSYWTALAGGGSGITRTELQDTAAAIRADIGTSPDLQGAINNGSTLTSNVQINATGHNLESDSFNVFSIITRNIDEGGQINLLGYYDSYNYGQLSVDRGFSTIGSYRTYPSINQSYLGTYADSILIRTDSLKIDIPSAQPGYVLKSSDTYGTATWQPASSGGSNVGDSLVRAFDSLAAHNTRIGANTVAIATKLNTSDSGSVYQPKFRSDTARTNIYTAIAARAALSGAAFTGRVRLQGVDITKDSLPITTTNRWAITVDTPSNRLQRYDLTAKLNTSDSALLLRQSFIFPTRRGYTLYPQIAGTRPLEIINLGNTINSSATAQQAPSALVKNNWSQIGIQNLVWDSTNTRWLQSVNLGGQSGASAYEAGYEGVTLHAVSGINFPLFNGTWHEGLQVRHSGVDGVAGLTSGQFVQAKFPIFIAYKSGTYTDDTHPWAGGSSTADNPMIWLQSNEVKGTTGEYFRIEQNTSTATGGQFHFRKSRGTYASRTAASSGDNAGVLGFGQWDGSSYQNTARVLSYMDSAANTNRVPQSLAFQTSQNITANVTTRMRIWNTGAVVIGGGNTAPSTGAIVDIQSTTGALVIPRMTTTQRNALTPVAGAMVYCTDCTATDGSTGVSQTYNGSAWKNHY